MCVESNTVFKCIHDTIINKELAFNRGKFYYSNYDGKSIYGENNKLYNINDFNFNNSFMSISNEKVDHPRHYSYLKELCGIEVIDITRHLDFDLGNAIKYILRSGHKEESSMTNKEKEIEDLQKAVWYLNDKIKMLENEK